MNEYEELSPFDQFMEDCAALYFARCDAYDAGRCSGISPRTGEPIPITPDEFQAVQRNALDVIATIVATKSITRSMLFKAIGTYGRRERGEGREK